MPTDSKEKNIDTLCNVSLCCELEYGINFRFSFYSGQRLSISDWIQFDFFSGFDEWHVKNDQIIPDLLDFCNMCTHSHMIRIEAARICDNKLFLSLLLDCKCYYYILTWLMIVIITPCGICSSLFTLNFFFVMLLLSGGSFCLFSISSFCLLISKITMTFLLCSRFSFYMYSVT